METLLTDIYSQPVKPIPEGGFVFDENFLLRVGVPKIEIESDLFVVSHDRGHTFEGPYRLPKFEYPITPRTCYQVLGEKHMRMFMSYKLPNLTGAAYSDRAFVAETHDGCQTFEMLGEMTNDEPRSVMPDVATLPDGTLVVALRRRIRTKNAAGETWDDNYIEVRRSADGGRTWTNPVRAAETAEEWNHNGNPPALRALPDGRLVLVYGYRGGHPAIKARVSCDGGLSWEKEIILRDDARHYDLGYPRLTVRPDGKLVAIYYYTTQERPEQHIAATVFEV